MAIIGDILNNLFGGDEDASSASSGPKPCTNCPSDCSLYPDKCESCKSYKTQLIDRLYDVDHLEDYYARYVVDSETAPAEGTVKCPACTAPNPASAFACQYCGTKLRDSDGKIHVSGASQIPDPIQQAQEVIFARREALGLDRQETSEGGLLEQLGDLLGGGSSTETSFGTRMSTEEIKTMAEKYGVSVSAYLQGLDNGKYRTYTGREQQTVSQSSAQSGLFSGSAAGILGAASAVGIGGSLLSHMGTQDRPTQSSSVLSQITSALTGSSTFQNERPPMPPKPPMQQGHSFMQQTVKPQQNIKPQQGMQHPPMPPQGQNHQSSKPQHSRPDFPQHHPNTQHANNQHAGQQHGGSQSQQPFQVIDNRDHSRPASQQNGMRPPRPNGFPRPGQNKPGNHNKGR